MDNFSYIELNRGSRFKDESKVATLGAWAYALGNIIFDAQENRKDLEIYDHNK